YSGDDLNQAATSCDEIEYVQNPTTLTTSLSGGGQSDPTIAVPESTAVTDTATLGVATAGSADSETVTFAVYPTSADCTGNTGALEGDSSSGELSDGTATSSAVTLASAGTYYWGVSYSGDDLNQAATSCDEIEYVQNPTTLTTSLSGGGQSDPTIAVPESTAVTDTATLGVATAGSADSETVTFAVYPTSADCTGNTGALEGDSSSGELSDGTATSSAVTLASAGTYYWGVSYSGDDLNQAATSCDEIEYVQNPTTLTTSLSGGGQSDPTIAVPESTAVTDTATLGVATAGSADSETVTFAVYPTSADCTGNTGALEGDSSSGELSDGTATSSAVTLASAGTYYWGVSYSGDDLNQAATSCDEIEYVQNPTTLTTSLSGGGQSDPTIAVPESTAV